jgi:hypothetical protein
MVSFDGNIQLSSRLLSVNTVCSSTTISFQMGAFSDDVKLGVAIGAT